MKRIDQLTITRFLSILLVFFYHGGGGVYVSWLNFFPFSFILRSAPTAVSYLYVLSGFIMTIVYHRPQEKFDITGYWKTRFTRIYPLYIISFLMVCYYYLEYMARIKPWKVLVNVFVLQAWWPPYAQSFNYASWSMTVEFFFYAVFPFFTIWAYRQSTGKLIKVSLILWGASQLVHSTLWVGFYPEWHLFLVYNPIFHLNSFIMGAVAGIWFLRESPKKPTHPAIPLILFILATLLLGGYTIMSNIVPNLPVDLQPMAGLLAPLLALVVVTLSLEKTKLSSFMSHPWLVTLGETAYALYILHVPVIWIYKRALFSSNVVDPGRILDISYIPIMIAIGLISYWYIDPPLRRGLKAVLAQTAVPILLTDMVILAASIYLSFRFRFADGREFVSYRQTMVLMFWAAFILRTALSVLAKSAHLTILSEGIRRILQSTLLSVTIGSILIAAIIFAGFSAGWFVNFPRSVFVLDWALVMGASTLTRVLYRGLVQNKKLKTN